MTVFQSVTHLLKLYINLVSIHITNKKNVVGRNSVARRGNGAQLDDAWVVAGCKHLSTEHCGNLAASSPQTLPGHMATRGTEARAAMAGLQSTVAKEDIQSSSTREPCRRR